MTTFVCLCLGVRLRATRVLVLPAADRRRRRTRGPLPRDGRRELAIGGRTLVEAPYPAYVRCPGQPAGSVCIRVHVPR